jgi:nucleotide-binding universal stress UspA family protein
VLAPSLRLGTWSSPLCRLAQATHRSEARIGPRSRSGAGLRRPPTRCGTARQSVIKSGPRALGIAEMSLPSCIVLATDLAPRTDRAQDRAVTLARDRRAKLVFVHAIELTDMPTDHTKEAAVEVARRRAHRWLQAEASNTGNVTPTVVVEQGNAAAVVLDAAQREGADLIVAGTAAIGALGQFLLGSTTRRLVAHARAPVLVVKKRGTPPYARVIVGTDLSNASVAALETAMALFRPSQVTLYHAFDMPYRGLVSDKAAYEADLRANALSETRAFASRHCGPSGDALNIEVGHGDAAPCIAQYAAQTEADLVLAGTHGRTGLLKAVLGSVASALMTEVPCDVMIVPSAGARSP